jgi:glycosyltransferase 2 family protein
VAPAAVTVVAVNTRYLQREGVRPGQAVASVGASQLAGMMAHVTLLILFGFATGYGNAESLTPSRTVVIVLLAVAVAAAAVTTVPPARRLILRRLRPLFSGVIPRLLDVLQTPRKLLTGLGGTLLLTGSFVLCLEASILAFGGSIGWTTVVIVFLTGNALGSAAPTPGGLGAVEGALTLGLTVGGLPAGTATSAVLLFRMLTFWLPVLPGWAAFTYLQRKEAI